MEYNEIIKAFYEFFLSYIKNKDVKEALEKEFGIIPELMIRDGTGSNIYKVQCFLNKLYIKDIKKIIELTKDRAIKIIFMKGIFLAADLYENYNYRLSCDLDILTCEEDLNQLHVVLQGIGYSCEEDLDKLVEHSRKDHLKYVKLIKGFGKLLIEVHTNICNPAHLYQRYTKWATILKKYGHNLKKSKTNSATNIS